MATFKLVVITPQKKILEQDADFVMMRTTEGDMGILAGHAPIVAELAVGEMKIKNNGEEVVYFVSGGFLDVSSERTLILADEAMNVRDIDVEKAKKDAEVAQQKLNKMKEDRDLAVTQKALLEALTKVRLAEHHM